jgi:L,D-peptidoglycan transpeptidase YkuD (ErfK/YbiS/YcfS/YnhG family)
MNLVVRHPDKVIFAGRTYRCALGRGGIGIKAGEGDGITPVGCFALKAVYFRPDRLLPPKTSLPVIPLKKGDGWCDAPERPEYNTLVEPPFKGSHEKMWRVDGLYDVVITIAYNDNPVIPGKGSAIFIHVVRPGFEATEGCIALRIADLTDILKDCTASTRIDIQAPQA